MEGKGGGGKLVGREGKGKEGEGRSVGEEDE